MKMHAQFRLFALLAVLFFSCKGKNEITKVEVTGEVKNIEALMVQYPAMFQADSLKLVLYEVPFGGETQPIQLDSAYVSKGHPKFKLEAQATRQALYDVLIDKGPMLPFVNDNPINLEIDLTNKEKYYTVTGSPASNTLREFIFGYSEKSIPAGNAFKALDSLKMTNSNDSAVIAATEQKNKSMESLNDYIRGFISKADNPLVAAFTLGMASRTFTQGEYDSSLTQVIGKYPADANLQYLKTQLKNTQPAEAQPEQGAWIGKPAPEMSMPDVDGKDVSLSSFKGKYVLVDFWASWCGPCRMENPNVVRAYQAFKNKNFTVVGVSLDKEKGNWLEAIKKDKLTWTHISDLAFWNSKSVELFGFQGIPYNVLINPEGVIIAESLRGDDLMKKLGEVVK